MENQGRRTRRGCRRVPFSSTTCGPIVPSALKYLSAFVTFGESLLHSAEMTHPLVSRIAPLMNGDLAILHREVARWVLESPTEGERNALRYFGAELGAVQRRIRRREEPPTEEEIEIALTAVLALVHRRAETEYQVS